MKDLFESLWKQLNEIPEREREDTIYSLIREMPIDLQDTIYGRFFSHKASMVLA